MSTLVKFSFRDYTTDGKFVGTQEVSIGREEIRKYVKESKELESLLATNKILKMFGVIKGDETVKQVFNTNIMIRDFKTNKLVKWSHLV